MQELFTGTSADGSLAMDQHTCTIDSHDSDNDEGLYDLNCYPQYDYMRALLRRILTLCQQHMVLKDLQFMYVLIIPHLAVAELVRSAQEVAGRLVRSDKKSRVFRGVR
ncbi:hypothetical protein VPH35_120949 [Triticum aestivum]